MRKKKKTNDSVGLPISFQAVQDAIKQQKTLMGTCFFYLKKPQYYNYYKKHTTATAEKIKKGDQTPKKRRKLSTFLTF